LASLRHHSKFQRVSRFGFVTAATSLTVGQERRFLWPPCVADADIIFLPCGFYISIYLSIFFSSPNLSFRRLDVYHTSTHGVALVRIKNAGLKSATRGSLQMPDPKKSPKIAIWAPSHNLLGYIFATKARIDNRKKTC